MTMLGTFVSVWDDGTEIRTPAILDETSGSVDADAADVDGVDILQREYFESSDLEEYEICPECHEYILKTEMRDGLGHTYNEVRVCSNRECLNQ